MRCCCTPLWAPSLIKITESNPHTQINGGVVSHLPWSSARAGGQCPLWSATELPSWHHHPLQNYRRILYIAICNFRGMIRYEGFAPQHHTVAWFMNVPFSILLLSLLRSLHFTQFLFVPSLVTFLSSLSYVCVSASDSFCFYFCSVPFMPFWLNSISTSSSQRSWLSFHYQADSHWTQHGMCMIKVDPAFLEYCGGGDKKN